MQRGQNFSVIGLNQCTTVCYGLTVWADGSISWMEVQGNIPFSTSTDVPSLIRPTILHGDYTRKPFWKYIMSSKRQAGTMKDEGGLTTENSILPLGHKGSHLCERVQNPVKKALTWKPLDFTEKAPVITACVGSGVPLPRIC